jgi:hypothetical protein
MGETCWRLSETPKWVLVEKGTESVNLQANRSEKTSFTAIGTISGAGRKLPFWVLAKGETQRCEQKFGPHPDVVIRHPDSGWATEDLIVVYIEWLHREVAKEYPCVLILDVYPGPRTDLVLAAADTSDVELLFVPAGGAARLRPLDRRIFGELKARAPAEFN